MMKRALKWLALNVNFGPLQPYVVGLYLWRWPRRVKKTIPDGFRFYGGNGTIHSTDHVSVETNEHGNVVAVWFRCQTLPFLQRTVNDHRAYEMIAAYQEYPPPAIHGLVLKDVDHA